jgi:hypothetical protein
MKLIKEIVKKALTTKPPVLNKKNIKLIKELKKNVLDIEIGLSANPTQSEKEWVDNRIELVEKISNENPLEFLQWDIIKRTMVASYPQRFVKKELYYLKKLPDWNYRWKNALKENAIGSPQKYPYFLTSSGNLIHQAFHISQFENFSKKHIGDYDLIFEFGGGYGAMCKLIHKLNFKGKYIIFDLPEFCALQKFYLAANGLITLNGDKGYPDKNNIFHVNQLHSKIMNEFKALDNQNVLFIANWSLSESPIDARDSITRYLSNFSSIMVAYQHLFGETDNTQYFNTFKNNFIKIKKWKEYQTPFMLNNYYLFGDE